MWWCILGVVAFFMYRAHDRDRYYALGEASVMLSEGYTISTDTGNTTLSKVGGGTTVYSGLWLYKLLKRKNYIE